MTAVTKTQTTNVICAIFRSDRYVVKIGDKKGMNIEVLAALGNNNADSFYL